MKKEMLRTGRLLFLGTSALASSIFAHAAFAQVSPDTPAAASTPSYTEPSEIVVTAQRRRERGQDVPIAITAFSQDRLQQQGITQAQSLQGTVPSLVVSNGGQDSREAQSFTIRGQGATFQSSPGVVIYLNEVPLPAPFSFPQQAVQAIS